MKDLGLGCDEKVEMKKHLESVKAGVGASHEGIPHPIISFGASFPARCAPFLAQVTTSCGSLSCDRT